MNDDLKRVEEKIREEFPPEKYELLVNFAAKLFIEGSIMKNERQDFSNAMFAMKLSESYKNKEEKRQAKKYVEKNFKNNFLFKQFMSVKLWSGRLASWHRNAALHKNDKKARELVKDWWNRDKENGETKDKVVKTYCKELGKLGLYPDCKTKSKFEKREKDEEKEYTHEAVKRWLTNK